MIFWATTVDPLTEFSATSLTSHTRLAEQGIVSFDTEVDKFFVRQNWSESATTNTGSTQFAGGGGTAGSYSTLSVLGLTSGEFFSAEEGAATERYTVVGALLNQTSTVHSRDYTYQATGTTEGTTERYVSTVEGTTTTSIVQTVAEILTTTSILTTSQSCYSTTTASPTLATPILATVYVAEASEAIWVLSTTAATDLSILSAATALATSTSRATIMPFAATVTAIQANSTQTTEATLPVVSQNLNFTKTQQTNYSSPQIINYSSLPHQSSLLGDLSKKTATSFTQYTVLYSEPVTFSGARFTETKAVNSTTTARAWLHGESFFTSGSRTSTITREFATDTFAETSSFYEVSAGDPEPDTAFNIFTVRQSTIQQITTFARQPQGIAIVNALGSSSREWLEGVVDASGFAALGYTCNSTLGLATDNVATLVSRGLSSIFPTTRSNSLASVTLSKLSVTAFFSHSTTTTSFELSPFGAALPTYSGPAEWASKIDPASLGQSETVYVTLPRGVYSEDGSTFSTTGKTTSMTQGQGSSSGAPLPVTFVVPDTVKNEANVIFWTASKNSHSSLHKLTAASAYSAA